MSTAISTFNFDKIIERRHTDSGKWGRFSSDPDVIPMWTADMDFRSPPAVIDALHERVEHGVFGYGYGGWTHRPEALLNVLSERMATRYDWQVQPDDFMFVPNIVSALYGMCRSVGEEGCHILVQTPNYWPFFSGADAANRVMLKIPAVASANGAGLRYEIDFDALEAAITPRTHLFMFSNPHNPVGRAYERWELERLADICLRHDLTICSDEIHCDLTYNGHEHIPMATLSPEVAARTITFMAPSKTFNVPGLKLGFAIAQNHELLQRLESFYMSIGVSTGVMGYVAAQAAYEHGQPWLTALLDYLTRNRDYAFDFVANNLPGVVPVKPEATYLMFMDCREMAVDGDPTEFFLNKAKVALSGGFDSQGFPAYTRLNFGCPHSVLVEALDRMKAALADQ